MYEYREYLRNKHNSQMSFEGTLALVVAVILFFKYQRPTDCGHQMIRSMNLNGNIRLHCNITNYLPRYLKWKLDCSRKIEITSVKLFTFSLIPSSSPININCIYSVQLNTCQNPFVLQFRRV